MRNELIAVASILRVVAKYAGKSCLQMLIAPSSHRLVHSNSTFGPCEHHLAIITCLHILIYRHDDQAFSTTREVRNAKGEKINFDVADRTKDVKRDG
jgi:hypothetical protein